MAYDYGTKTQADMYTDKVRQEAYDQARRLKAKAAQEAAAQERQDDLDESRGAYVGWRQQLVNRRGWQHADQDMWKQGYRDPRVAIEDPWVQRGIPGWGDRERYGVMRRTQAARGRQVEALNILAQQAGETPAAANAAAYRGEQALTQAAAAQAAGSPGAYTSALDALGTQGAAISGKAMGQASAEGLQARAGAAQAADAALGGYTKAAQQGAAYQALALQDKANRMAGLTAFEKENYAREVARAKANGIISEQDANFYLGMAGLGSSAAASGASMVSSGYEEGKKNNTSGYQYWSGDFD